MASIDDLLSTLHRHAAGLHPGGHPDRQLDAHLNAWAPLAAHARRALEALDARPSDQELYGLLRTIAGTGRPGRTDAGLARVALTVGALGDAIMSLPEPIARAGQAQRSRLQASIQAALYASARATLDIARNAEQPSAAEILHRVAETTELAAMLPPRARISTLDGLTVTRLTPDTADGAVQLWADTAQRTFTNDRIVTGIALQDAAATLALLCQISADALRDAARRRILDPDAARHVADLLSKASVAWRKAAAWPAHLQLGGRAAEHQHAVRAVREALTGPPLARLTLRERAHTLRAALGAAVTVGEVHSATVARLAHHGGLWIAHERPNFRPPGVERHHVKLDWEPMDAGDSAGKVVVDRSSSAAFALSAAAHVADQTILHAASPRGEIGPIRLVDDRVVAGWWETVDVAAPTRRPDDHTAANLLPEVNRTVSR